MAEDEPVAFLLERRDSLRLSDDVANQMVRLNSRLFRRVQPLRFTVDTILARAGERPWTELRRRGQPIPPALQERIDPYVQEMRVNAEAARDTAWAMLTPEQREKAAGLFERARTPQRR